MNMPVINKRIKQRILDTVKDVFGGNMYQIIVGGASLNKEIEQFLTSIDFPITVGYGTTETAPLITFSDHSDFVPGSCGTQVSNMEVKIKSVDPQNIPGEIITRGHNVMIGYYKNEEATNAVLDKDGWYHTGDLATIDETGHIFIRGRIKNMLLGANGQNIYPEEIEDKLSNMSLVNECLVVQRGQKLVGLVYPDQEQIATLGLSESDIEAIMERNRQDINPSLPAYAQLTAIKVMDKEFEKTPKKSIKRFLYINE